jgi:hypothetical protein
MKQVKQIFWLGAAIILLAGLWGCGGKTTPPGAAFMSDSFIVSEGFGGAFEVLQWAEGPTVVLVHDIEGEHENSGSSSTEDPVWRGKGFARSADGRQISWRAETRDGKTVTFFIDEQEYDLRQGTLFFIRTTEGQTQVAQRQLSLSRPCANLDDCRSWLIDTPLVQQFIQESLSAH